MHKQISYLLAATASLGATAQPATAASPRIIDASDLRAIRAEAGYYTLGAVVRLDRPLKSINYGLIAVRWAFRSHLTIGQRLPDELFAGATLGRAHQEPACPSRPARR